MPDADLSAQLRDAILADPLGGAISSVQLVGSEARGDARPDSDIDLIVEFKPGHMPGFGFFGLARRLEERMHRHVDLTTPDGIRPAFRSYVLRHARRII